ncbi:MAG: element excision factor XisH family protein [bacterium]|nr:element excision factor XisH family protein [bacterium]
MPALDQCEPQILRALYKQGWHILDKPLAIRVEQGQRYLFADVRLSNIHTQDEIIIVEIKCFSHPRTLMDDLYSAIGQYTIYQQGLMLNSVFSKLFLAMPHDIYLLLRQDKLIASTLNHVKINIITVNFEREEVELWITY